MSEAETLRTIAELGIAIAGFTGVVVVFGSRARGEWTPFEANRLWLLLSQALVVALFSFLPILLHAGGLEERAGLRLSNGLFAAATWAIGGHMALRQRYLRQVATISRLARCLEYATFAGGAGISVTQIVHALGALPRSGAFLFLLALLFLLTASVTNFWRLLMGSLVVGTR